MTAHLVGFAGSVRLAVGPVVALSADRGLPDTERASIFIVQGRGPLRYLAEPFAHRTRARRVKQFLRLAGVDATTRIVDIGCGPSGLLGLAPGLNVTGVDIRSHDGYPGRLVCADATERLPFADNEFDLAYSSSVIEHISPERRATFAHEVRRVARGWYVQTPAFEFPIEPHSLLPAAHWLPRSVRRRYWRLGTSQDDPDEIYMMRQREMEALFGPAFPEVVGPFIKSWICMRPPSPRASRGSGE